MAQIRWSSASQRDLKIISDYIAIDSEFYAEKVIDRIYTRVAIFETHTLIGKVVSEFNNPSIRELIEDPYRIIYKINNEMKFQ